MPSTPCSTYYCTVLPRFCTTFLYTEFRRMCAQALLCDCTLGARGPKFCVLRGGTPPQHHPIAPRCLHHIDHMFATQGVDNAEPLGNACHARQCP